MGFDQRESREETEQISALVTKHTNLLVPKFECETTVVIIQ